MVGEVVLRGSQVMSRELAEEGERIGMDGVACTEGTALG